ASSIHDSCPPSPPSPSAERSSPRSAHCWEQQDDRDHHTDRSTASRTPGMVDAGLVGGSGGKPGRRGLAVTAMLLGAVIGGLLALNVDTAAPLSLAAIVLASVRAAATRF